jgi:Tol biopolymer transport system component
MTTPTRTWTSRSAWAAACTAAGVVALLVVLPSGASAAASGPTRRVSVTSAGAQANGLSGGASMAADGSRIAFESYASNLVPMDHNNVGDVFVRDLTSNTTTRVSVASDGSDANSYSGSPAISADGRYIAFVSDASDLVPGDANRTSDVFVRGLASNTTTRISVASDGSDANSYSGSPAISADGRYIAFVSDASDLVPGDTNGVSDVFVRDLASDTTTRVSIASNGTQADGYSGSPAISADGRYVAFDSDATSFVASDSLGMTDVFVHDMASGTTIRTSVASNGAEANGNSYAPSITSDGRYVALYSDASNLVAGDTNGQDDVFLRDLVSDTTTRVSTTPNGGEANGFSGSPSISADGHFVAFDSAASNLATTDTNARDDVFVRDMVHGTVTCASADSAGVQGNGYSFSPSISADGRYSAFESDASDLVTGDTNGVEDVFVNDRIAPPPVVVSYVRCSNPIAYDLKSLLTARFSTRVNVSAAYAVLSVATPKGPAYIYRGAIPAADRDFTFPEWNGRGPDGAKLPPSSYVWTLTVTKGDLSPSTTTGKILVSNVTFTVNGKGTARAQLYPRYMIAASANCYISAFPLSAVLTGPGHYSQMLSSWLSTPASRTVYLRGARAPTIKSTGSTPYVFSMTAPAGSSYSMSVVQ